MKKVRAAIFDFDGTVADSTSIIYAEVKKELKKHGLSESKVNQIEEMGVSKFLREVEISKIKVVWIALKIQKRLGERINEADLFDGVEPLLKRLKEEKVSLGMVTNNKKRTVKKFIKINDLDFFPFIYSNLFLRSKVRKLEKAVKSVAAKKEEIVYIGDQADDVLDAKKVGIKSIGVTWGLSNFDELKKVGPDYIADSPEEIYDFLIRS